MTEQPHPDRVRLLPWALPAIAIDAVLIGLIAFAWLTRLALEELTVDRVAESVGAVLAVGVIAGRRRWPLPALSAGLLVTIGLVLVTGKPSVVMLATLVALHHLATVMPLRSAVIAGVAGLVVFTSLVLVVVEPGRLDGGLLASIGWPAFATASGAAVKAGRENLAAARERALRAEATREVEARRRVAEERLRIARDVHDLVAHHLAVINVQAGVAGHVLRSDQDAAETALGVVRESASNAVHQLGELLSVLRTPADGPSGDDGRGRGPTAPTPDLQAVDDLISSFRAGGLGLEHTVTGAPRPLGPASEVAVYRVVQEALTNAHKHGDGTARLTQRFDDDGLTLRVANPLSTEGPPPVANGTGYGLIGMRERVEAVGGELIVDQGGATFVVTARFPAQGHRPESDTESEDTE